MDLEPVDLFSAVLRLRPGGTVSFEQRRMDADDDGWTVAITHAETDDDVHSDHWEVHPGSEEAVCVLAGQARLYLRSPASQRPAEAVTISAATGVVIPRNRWHRFELDAPTTLMSIALRAGSRLEKRS